MILILNIGIYMCILSRHMLADQQNTWHYWSQTGDSGSLADHTHDSMVFLTKKEKKARNNSEDSWSQLFSKMFPVLQQVILSYYLVNPKCELWKTALFGLHHALFIWVFWKSLKKHLIPEWAVCMGLSIQVHLWTAIKKNIQWQHCERISQGNKDTGVLSLMILN